MQIDAIKQDDYQKKGDINVQRNFHEKSVLMSHFVNHKFDSNVPYINRKRKLLPIKMVYIYR